MRGGTGKQGLKQLAGSWFLLTPSERRAVCLVIALALVGLAVRSWHARVERKQAPQEAHASARP